MRTLLPMATLGLVAFTSTAVAGDVYIGLAAGQTSFKNTSLSSSFNVDDTGYKVFVGYEIWRFFAVELGYTDHGTFNDVNRSDPANPVMLSAESQSLALWAIGILPATPRLSLWGKLGYANTDVDGSASDTMMNTEPFDVGDQNVAWGFGLGYNFTSKWALTLEFEAYSTDSDTDVELGSLGFHYTF
jgi:OOP family OmpA-OmpF porin